MIGWKHSVAQNDSHGSRGQLDFQLMDHTLQQSDAPPTNTSLLDETLLLQSFFDHHVQLLGSHIWVDLPCFAWRGVTIINFGDLFGGTEKQLYTRRSTYSTIEAILALMANMLRRWLSRSRSSQNYALVVEDTKSSPDPAQFLKLPREIRDMIYQELLLNTFPIIVHLRRVHRFEASTTPYPAILQTNKQVHDEAAAMLYGENTWFSAAPAKFFYWADELYAPESSTYVVEPGPINTYLPWIKHFVLFPEGPPDWVRDKIVKAGDVDLMLKRMGIQRLDLKQLIIGVSSRTMSEEIMRANSDWLEIVDEAEMQSRFSWFTQRGTQPAFWLVST